MSMTKRGFIALDVKIEAAQTVYAQPSRKNYMGHNETNYKETIMKRFYEKLKRQAMENPLLTVAIATAAVTAAAKLLEASTQHKYAITHEREVDRRIAMMQYK